MVQKPSINIEWNSEIMDAFLEFLLLQWYAFDTLIDNQHDFYIISRENDNKLWLVSETWWFNGDSFWSEEYWFDGIDTQEIWDDVFLEIWDGGTRKMYKLENGILKWENWDKIRMDIQDLIELALVKNTWNIN